MNSERRDGGDDESIAWEKEPKGLYRAMKRQALKRMLKELADEDSKR